MQQNSVDLSLSSRAHALSSNLLFPKISKEAARITRLMSDTRLQRLLAEYAGVETIDVLTQTDQPISQVAASTALTVLIRILHREGQAQACFDAKNWPILYMLAASSNAPSVASSAELHQAIVDILLAPVAQKLEALGLEALHFEDLRVQEDVLAIDDAAIARLSKPLLSKPPTFDKDVVVRCKLGSMPPTHFSITLKSIDESLLDYCEQLLDLQPLPLFESVLNLGIPGQALIGAQNITLGALCRLRCGDVLIGGIQPEYKTILSPSPSLSHLVLSWGLPGARALRGFAALEGQNLVMKEGLIVHQTHQTDEQSVEDNEDITQMDSELPDLAELDMPVHFEIDTVVMPLARLCALGAGHIMELPISLAHAPVRLITHGKTIGSGELVAIGDHLGIRIQKMAKIDG